MLVIKHRWFVPIFKVSTCSNLCAKVFPCDMTHFNICKPISWTATTMHKCINNIKTASCFFNEHFIISPCFLYFNDIYMQQKLPPLQTPPLNHNRILKCQRKFKWHTESNEESNSFSFPIENCKDLSSNNFRYDEMEKSILIAKTPLTYCDVYWLCFRCTKMIALP